MTVYDTNTRCLIQNGQLRDLSSRMNLKWNKDGSVNLCFGPEASKDKELHSNLVKTIPGKK